MSETLIPKHGGYRKLKSFQVSRLVYDITVRFCDRYIDKRSRTRDQMVQAARSGVQNIAEGSHSSATSRKMELKLTQVARASLEELRLDYEDFLRQRGLPELESKHPVLLRFKAKQCRSVDDVSVWVLEERTFEKERRTNTDGHRPAQTGENGMLCDASLSVCVRPCGSSAMPLSSSTLAANAALSLLNLACYLLDRQVATLAESFEKGGGFTERLYRTRVSRRRNG